MKIMMWSIIIGIFVLILFYYGVLFITFDRCTLPVDVVLYDTCLFGSLGGSLGLTLLATLFVGAIGLVLRLVFGLLRN